LLIVALDGNLVSKWRADVKLLAYSKTLFSHPLQPPSHCSKQTPFLLENCLEHIIVVLDVNHHHLCQ